MKKFPEIWPDGFHKPLEKKVVSMLANRKQTKIGKEILLDKSLIYSRILCLQGTRDIYMNLAMKHELSPVQAPLFDDHG